MWCSLIPFVRLGAFAIRHKHRGIRGDYLLRSISASFLHSNYANAPSRFCFASHVFPMKKQIAIICLREAVKWLVFAAVPLFVAAVGILEVYALNLDGAMLAIFVVGFPLGWFTCLYANIAIERIMLLRLESRRDR